MQVTRNDIMADLKRLSGVLTNYSLIIFLGAIISLLSPITFPISSNVLHIVTGGLPLAILYLLYRGYRGKTEVAKYEIPLLLTPILLSPLLGILIALVMRLVDRF